ncbi:MAG: DUF3079 domain-containing protein [Polyangiaceae bacterium]|nr:DUF3079 domain-containing protein [Polyangiaceae bacterium]
MADAPLPRNPPHPERICWGCEKLCPAGDLTCGNGTERTPHPAELFGADWYEWRNESAPGALGEPRLEQGPGQLGGLASDQQVDVPER